MSNRRAQSSATAAATVGQHREAHASALLPLCPPSVAAVLIGHVDSTGTIIRKEATGAGGCYVAEVTTTVGAARSAVSVLPIDPSDAALTRVRTTLDQALTGALPPAVTSKAADPLAWQNR